MGGTMNFSSEPDAGSNFYFTFTTTLDTSVNPGPLLGSLGYRVMLVDPIGDRAKILSTKLSYWGFEVICLTNALETRDVLRSTSVDVILSDDRDAPELLKIVGDLPVIFMGYTPKKEFEGKYFIKTPAHEDTLKNMLLSVLNKQSKPSVATPPKGPSFKLVKPEQLRVLLVFNVLPININMCKG
jgi:hypothetical protein